MIKELLTNISVLSVFLFLFNKYAPVSLVSPERRGWPGIMRVGLIMGAMGIALMYVSFRVSATGILDYRHLLIVCSLLFGGAYSALLTTLVIAAGRIALFGGFNASSEMALVMMALIYVCSCLTIKLVASYWKRWLLFIALMTLLPSGSMFLVMGRDAAATVPAYVGILLAGSVFVASFIRYLSASNRQEQLLRENEREYRSLSLLKDAVFHSASEVSILVTDAAGQITMFNKGAEKMLGYAAEEMIGQATPLLIHVAEEVELRGRELSALFGRPVGGFDVLVEWSRQGLPEEREWTYVRKDGSLITVNLIVSSFIYEGQIAGFVGIATDITEKKKAEEELMLQHEELQAQNMELESQQEELIEALAKREASENSLRRRNQLAVALIHTSDKRQLLQSIVDAYVELSDADKGIIVTFEEPRGYAAAGVTEAGAAQFMRYADSGVRTRLEAERAPYVIKRESLPPEKGFHLGKLVCHDLHVPVFDSKGRLAAAIVVSRFHPPVGPDEEAEALGLANQVALALEKHALYEDSLRQRELTQNMLNTIKEGVQLIDLTGHILQVNTQFCELMGGCDHERLTGDTVQSYFEKISLLVEESAELVACIERLLQQPEQESVDFNYTMHAPVHRMIHMYHEPLYRDGQVFGVLLVHRDVTKEFELDRLKMEFVNTVSHELRTPLSSVLGFTELMLHKKELAADKQTRYLTTIHRETLRLTSLVNDILDLQRMEAGKQGYQFAPVDISEIAANVIELHKVHVKNHRLLSRLQPGEAIVHGDEDKLTQLLTNLVSNAIKYSPQGGDIVIAASLRDGYWELSVEDHGLGIPENALEHLFEKFYRIQTAGHRQIGGTGLGLSIVKEIVTAHGGRIAVASRYGEGSTFTVSLPASRT